MKVGKRRWKLPLYSGSDGGSYRCLMCSSYGTVGDPTVDLGNLVLRRIPNMV